jgi:hypothetical protein
VLDHFTFTASTQTFVLRLEGVINYVEKCGILMVRVPGYGSRGPGSIPDATRFSEKQWVWNGVHSAS